MIRIEKIDKKEALRYLACHDEDMLTEDTALLLDECEKMLLEVLSPKFIYRYFPLEWEKGYPLVRGCRIDLRGNDIREHLEGCSGIIFMCATAGIGADRLIHRLQAENMAKAVVTDAFAGAAVEQICNEAEKIITDTLKGKFLTWRFSPGYGDFPLEIQKAFLDVTDAVRKIGICVTDSMMLTPTKSVTAVIGVSDSPVPNRRRGCMTCNLRESCQFRKRGDHCGS